MLPSWRMSNNTTLGDNESASMYKEDDKNKKAQQKVIR